MVIICCFLLSAFCIDDIFRSSAQHFVAKLIRWCIVMSRMSCKKIGRLDFQGLGHYVGSYDQNMTFLLFSDLLILLQLNLIWWYIISLSILVKRLDCSVFKFTAKHQNVIECAVFSDPPIFCNQTWYSDASSSAGVSREKIGLLSSRSRSQRGLICWNIFCRNTVSSELFSQTKCKQSGHILTVYSDCDL